MQYEEEEKRRRDLEMEFDIMHSRVQRKLAVSSKSLLCMLTRIVVDAVVVVGKIGAVVVDAVVNFFVGFQVVKKARTFLSAIYLQ